MEKVMKFAATGLALTLLLFAQPALADMDVVESSVPGIKEGTTLKDDARLKIPERAIVRVLVKTPTGNTTMTLRGPYEGTVGNYTDDTTWWDRLFGNGTDKDPPMATTRDITPEKGTKKVPGQ